MSDWTSTVERYCLLPIEEYYQQIFRSNHLGAYRTDRVGFPNPGRIYEPRRFLDSLQHYSGLGSANLQG